VVPVESVADPVNTVLAPLFTVTCCCRLEMMGAVFGLVAEVPFGEICMYRYG